jgi:hypothetical protein
MAKNTLKHVKPAAGRLVRDPAKGYARMPAEGYAVDLSRQWWARRWKCGDVVSAAPALRPGPLKSTKKKKAGAVKAAPAKEG